MITRILPVAVAALTLTACGADTKTTAAAPSSGSPATEAAAPSPSESDDRTTTVGQWAHASDGLDFRVSRIERGTISDTSAGGHPGGPAVVVFVQLRNGTGARFDMGDLTVTVRAGDDGTDSERVYQDGYDSLADGSLSPARTATFKQMFTVPSKAAFKTIAVEVAPGAEYPTATFEGTAY
ncbi:hypothetical protein [Actinomadura parmotrematis]|uniref:DUF4352 domain-containing protein n=1 Tax=Actinomadura parmotrematis TaxID=2864039 RepID=A0ABS7FN84_9ACTN|nr:hypothetical protein [Actinomadura parmotrematis]MBW8481843.1 hypothetical protein [Actinomadura parmotrematis]